MPIMLMSLVIIDSFSSTNDRRDLRGDSQALLKLRLLGFWVSRNEHHLLRVHVLKVFCLSLSVWGECISANIIDISRYYISGRSLESELVSARRVVRL